MIPATALLAQGFDHVVDIAVLHLRMHAVDLQLGDVDRTELRHDFEGGGIADFILGVGRLGLDVRLPGDAHVFLTHGLVEAGADQFTEGFGADLLAETLLNDLGRHFALAETFQVCLAGHIAQAVVDHRGQAVGGNGNRHAALEITGTFY